MWILIVVIVDGVVLCLVIKLKHGHGKEKIQKYIKDSYSPASHSLPGVVTQKWNAPGIKLSYFCHPLGWSGVGEEDVGGPAGRAWLLGWLLGLWAV